MGTPSSDTPLAPSAPAPSAVDERARRADQLLAAAPSAISAELADLATRAIELETTELEPSSRRTYQYLTATTSVSATATGSTRSPRRPCGSTS